MFFGICFHWLRYIYTISTLAHSQSHYPVKLELSETSLIKVINRIIKCSKTIGILYITTTEFGLKLMICFKEKQLIYSHMVLFKPYRTPVNKQDMYYSTVVPPYQWGGYVPRLPMDA